MLNCNSTGLACQDPNVWPEVADVVEPKLEDTLHTLQI